MANSSAHTDFVHLHCHSQYSLLDGASQIPDLIELARADGQPALAITDHGNLFGAVEFYIHALQSNSAAEKEGKPSVTPIIGMEGYITPYGRDRFWKDSGSNRRRREEDAGLAERGSYHLILLAENDVGYKNLIKLASCAYLEGFYRKPRIDHDLLAQHADGLIMTSTDVGGEIAQMILNGGYEKARDLAGHYMDIIGKDNFFFEIQDHSSGHPLDDQYADQHHELTRIEAKINQAVIKMAKEFNRPVVATNDAHYSRRDDAAAHDILLCIATGKTLAEPNRMRFPSDDFYFKTAAEMHAVFDKYDVRAVENTLLIAERCNVQLQTTIGKQGTEGYHMPVMKMEDGVDPVEFFRKKTFEGLEKRYGAPIPAHVLERAEEELGHIIRLGFVGYLLLVYDIVSTAREMNIPVGPGRGSAAGSIVTYALGITNIDPLPYDLLFERFINPGRNEMPDIDIDFCQARRQELIDRIVEKYGRENVANIITFGTLGAKLAIRDTCRVLDIPLATADKWAKMIPDGPKQSLDKVLKSDADVQKLYADDAEFKRVWDIASRIEGTARNSGVHAAGIVIADKPIREYTALYKDPKTQTVTTQNHMKLIDPIGLLKVDFLGLQTLTSLNMTLDFIEKRHGVRIPIDEIPRIPAPDYEKLPKTQQHKLFPPEKITRTYRMLADGDSKGLFQFESDGMRRLLQQARPDRLEDLIALNAMYRPGPMQFIDSFIARKHGREPITYPHPSLEPILKDTYGIIVYQEQVMRIANVLAGFNLSEADKLRKAMGKKILAVMEQYHGKFLAGAKKLHGVPEQRATEIWNTIEQFAKYGFNKSHSTAYAFIALQTAYLKANYPAEFMAAQITLDQNKTDKVVALIDESRSLGIEVKPPCVNESMSQFMPINDTVIRFGLAAIKGCGTKAMDEVVREREKHGPYEDLFDFCERVDLRLVNKTAVESLVKAGAFDFCCSNRRRLFESAPRAIARGQAHSRDAAQGLVSLFAGHEEPATFKELLPDIAPWPDKQKASEEKSVLGFYLTSHPLRDHRRLIAQLSTLSTKTLDNAPGEMPLCIGGMIAKYRVITTKSNKKMAFVTLEDPFGTCEITLFPGIYEKFREFVVEDTIVFILGTVDRSREEKVSIQATHIIPMEQAFDKLPIEAILSVRAGELDTGRIDTLVDIVTHHRGPSPLSVVLMDARLGTVRMKIGDRFRITPDNAFELAIKSVFGDSDLIIRRLDDIRAARMIEDEKNSGNGSGRYRKSRSSVYMNASRSRSNSNINP